MNGRIPVIVLIAMLEVFVGFTSQTTPAWTAAELAAANTAKNVTYLDSAEKEIIKYCNLARMYPKRFAIIVVDGHYFGPDAASLSKELKAIAVRKPLEPDSVLTASANCFQQEQEKSGATGHDRKNCTDDFYAENCSYGQSDPKGVVMQLLIDEGVPSHGHRWNILGADYTKIGVALGGHKQYLNCAVIDFK